MKKHIHDWKITWKCGSEINEKCQCGVSQERQATKAEQKIFKAQHKESNRRTSEMNNTYWEFRKKFKDNNNCWIYEKYELIEKIEKWVEKQDREKVVFCSCDDSMFMSSDLLMFHHIWTDQKTKKKNCWGTSVVLLTQDGQPPTEFFLYPGHAQGLIDSLSKVWKIRERR